MAIILNDNLKTNSPKALDERFVQDTINTRDAIDLNVRFEGLLCYVKENLTLYQLQSGITNGDWVVVGGDDFQNLKVVEASLSDLNLISFSQVTPEIIETYVSSLDIPLGGNDLFTFVLNKGDIEPLNIEFGYNFSIQYNLINMNEESELQSIYPLSFKINEVEFVIESSFSFTNDLTGYNNFIAVLMGNLEAIPGINSVTHIPPTTNLLDINFHFNIDINAFEDQLFEMFWKMPTSSEVKRSTVDIVDGGLDVVFIHQYGTGGFTTPFIVNPNLTFIQQGSGIVSAGLFYNVTTDEEFTYTVPYALSIVQTL